MGVQVLCVFTSASNLNSFYGLKIWGYIDFSRVCRVSTSVLTVDQLCTYKRQLSKVAIIFLLIDCFVCFLLRSHHFLIQQIFHPFYTNKCGKSNTKVIKVYDFGNTKYLFKYILFKSQIIKCKVFEQSTCFTFGLVYTFG